MNSYKIKSIDSQKIARLKLAMDNYNKNLKYAKNYSDIRKRHDELFKAFSELVDARNEAIFDSFPIEELDINFNNTVTVLLDENVEKILDSACETLMKVMENINLAI